jgi:serine/threonine protein kinase
LEQRLDEEGTHMPLRPTSELPPRPRIRRPSVNGKIYVPKRPQSPASPSLSMHGALVQSPHALMDAGSEFGVSRIMTKEERRRSADCVAQGVTAGRIMNMRNQSMVNLPSRRTSTLSRDRDSMVHGSFQILEFTNSEGHESVRYQLGNCIGRGQFGSVYRSLNLSTGQMVAIKRIRLSGVKEKEVRDVMREVEVLQRLSHPGIVKYEGMSRDDQFLNIVLEFVENGSLGQTLKAFGKFNERLVASYVAKILEGLHYLHSQGVVHCDLKAANILSTKNGNIKLSDFGVSLNMRAVENFAERASIGRTVLKNEIAGTPNWMAPEVIKLSGASPASDIWSLGCTIIELITGKPPYSDVPNSMTVLFRIVEDPMPPMPETSPELQDFLKLCFVKEPALRPTAAMLFEHEWVRDGRGDLLARPQDSLPFLRRLSQEPAHHRIDAQRVFSSSTLPGAPSASASLVDLGDTAHLAQMSMVSLHSHVVHHKDEREGSPEASAPGGKAHKLVKMTVSKAITCHVCLQGLKKQAQLCETCGLITHPKCAARAHPKCDVREQLALLVHHQDWSVTPSGANSPYEPTGLGISSLPGRLFSRNKSKSSLAVPSPTSLSDSRRRYSSGGSTPGHLSPGVDPASLRSRLSDHSDETGGTGPRHPNPSTSLLRIDEDATYDRPVIRIDEPEREVERKMPPPVENTGKRRSVRGDKRGDCVVQ